MFNVAFVPGPGVGDEHMKAVLADVPGAHQLNGATVEQAVTYLRERHKVEGWADELEYPEYRAQHVWGTAMIGMLEQAHKPVVVPVRHGAYVVTCDVS